MAGETHRLYARWIGKNGQSCHCRRGRDRYPRQGQRGDLGGWLIDCPVKHEEGPEELENTLYILIYINTWDLIISDMTFALNNIQSKRYFRHLRHLRHLRHPRHRRCRRQSDGAAWEAGRSWIQPHVQDINPASAYLDCRCICMSKGCLLE